MFLVSNKDESIAVEAIIERKLNPISQTFDTYSIIKQYHCKSQYINYNKRKIRFQTEIKHRVTHISCNEHWTVVKYIHTHTHTIYSYIHTNV